jgi:hypothetical protein
VFTMVSDLGKLKRKVDLLGSAKDTVSHRYTGLTPCSWPWDTAPPAVAQSCSSDKMPCTAAGQDCSRASHSSLCQ